MRYTIENESLKIEIDSYGAELKSVVNKKTGFEYMWCANPEYWGRTSPILFPFVGDLVDKKYRFEDKEYSMSSHGFARDSEFELKEKSETEIWFELKDSAKTYSCYPFHFELLLGYVVRGMELDVLWKVKNPGQDRQNDTLFFNIGAHPAFNCPINGEPDKSGYKLNFGSVDKIKHHGNLYGTCTHEDLTLELSDGRTVITKEFFDRTTYIVEGNQTGFVAIETPDGHAYVKVLFDTPLFGIWSPTQGKNAPFVCIEPWCGRADWDDYAGTLEDREYTNSLNVGEVFENKYTVVFD